MAKGILKDKENVCKRGKSKLGQIIKAIFVGGLISVITMTSLAACSTKKDKAINSLNSSVLNDLNSSAFVQEIDNNEFSEFIFTGAEFENVSQDVVDVDVYGVSHWKEDDKVKKAYTTLNYSVEKNVIGDLKSAYETLKNLNDAINEMKPNSISFAELSSVKDFNKTAKSFVDRLPDSVYDFDNALIYAVDGIEFDEQNGQVSFTTKTKATFVHTWTSTMMIFNGHGFIPFIQTHYDYQDSIQTHRISLNVTQEELSEMKNDSCLILDKFVEVMKNKDKSKYIISSLKTEENDKILNEVKEKELD